MESTDTNFVVHFNDTQNFTKGTMNVKVWHAVAYCLRRAMSTLTAPAFKLYVEFYTLQNDTENLKKDFLMHRCKMESEEQFNDALKELEEEKFLLPSSTPNSFVFNQYSPKWRPNVYGH